MLVGSQLNAERRELDATQVVLVIADVARVSVATLSAIDGLLEQWVPAERRAGAALLVWQTAPSGENEADAESQPALGSLGFRQPLDNGVLQANERYFVPSFERLWFEGKRLRVAMRAPHHHNPIDRSLFSMAETWGRACVSILAAQLAGDGECGQHAIQIAGGLVLSVPIEPGECSGGAAALDRGAELSALEAAQAQVVTQRQRHAALARISELALGATDQRNLYVQALELSIGSLGSCRAGLIAELPVPGGELDVSVSRGLGADARVGLRSFPGAEGLLRAAIQRAEPVSSQDSLAALAGLACPIFEERRVRGVIALFGPLESLEDGGVREFMQAVAGMLGGALLRQRTCRRLALELEVDTLLAGAAELDRLGPGLLRALGSALGVEHVDLWSARNTRLERWDLLLSGAARVVREPSWPAVAAVLAASEGVSEAFSDDPCELLVPLPRAGLPPSLLRLRGEGLGTPDPELRECLARIARRVSDFRERQTSRELARQSAAALRDAERQTDEFLAMLGHELRNPMAALQNATELLLRIEPASPALQRLQSVFARQTAQTTKLIDGLLDAARVAHGKVELELVPLRLVELVRQVVDDRRQQFEKRELVLQLPEEEACVLADRVRLVQILDNLLGNALESTVERGRITVSVALSAASGSIHVEDDGVGIESQLLGQIFQPFRQGSGSARRSRGLGLGLALAKGLCELHGWELVAHSGGPGCGARFELVFPRVEAVDVPAPRVLPEARALELLLVEDNVDVAETLADLLGAVGHQVEVAGSAERALEVLRDRRPDVVLCDIGLPGMDGIELASRLRADPLHRSSRLVAMTGFGDASTQARISAAGFDRQLIKPVQLDALRQCLAKLSEQPAGLGSR